MKNEIHGNIVKKLMPGVTFTESKFENLDVDQKEITAANDKAVAAKSTVWCGRVASAELLICFCGPAMFLKSPYG